MKYLLLLLLAGCAPLAPHPQAPESEPISQRKAIRTAFDGHPPVETMDLEATPDSIATVIAEYYYIKTKHPTKWMRLLSKLPLSP